MREVVNIYYLDQPLSKLELASTLLSLFVEHIPGGVLDIKQRRVPAVFPVQMINGQFCLELPDYVSIFKKHFIRAGAAVSGNERSAYLHPEYPSHNPLNAVLVLALREATGGMPYILKRRPGTKSRIRIVAPDQLTRVLDQKLSDIGIQTNSRR